MEIRGYDDLKCKGRLQLSGACCSRLWGLRLVFLMTCHLSSPANDQLQSTAFGDTARLKLKRLFVVL
jgi:hypothetical protein